MGKDVYNRKKSDYEQELAAYVKILTRDFGVDRSDLHGLLDAAVDEVTHEYTLIRVTSKHINDGKAIDWIMRALGVSGENIRESEQRAI